MHLCKSENRSSDFQNLFYVPGWCGGLFVIPASVGRRDSQSKLGIERSHVSKCSVLLRDSASNNKVEEQLNQGWVLTSTSVFMHMSLHTHTIMHTHACMHQTHMEIEKEPRKKSQVWNDTDFYIFFKIVILFNMCECLLSYISTTWMLCPQKKEESIRSPGIEVTESCEPQYGCWELILCPL